MGSERDGIPPLAARIVGFYLGDLRDYDNRAPFLRWDPCLGTDGDMGRWVVERDTLGGCTYQRAFRTFDEAAAHVVGEGVADASPDAIADVRAILARLTQ